jgi:hypothetical protein
MSGFGPAPLPPNPLERDLVEQKQEEIDQAARKGRDEERAAEARKGRRRRWFALWRRG